MLTSERLAEIEAQARAAQKLTKWATPLPWRWWTSCSFRRLSSDPSGKDGDVAHARIASDGVPDIAIREEDMALIEHAVNNCGKSAFVALEMAEEIRRLHDRERDWIMATGCAEPALAAKQLEDIGVALGPLPEPILPAIERLKRRSAAAESSEPK